MMSRALATLRAVAAGYAPKALQARGWVLCALAFLPALAAFLAQAAARASASRMGLMVFHAVLVPFAVPVMALVAAPGGIREDLERRTLPLLLVRPGPAWILPLGKGLVWFAWGAFWLVAGQIAAALAGQGAETAAFQALALVLAYWAELAFLNLLILVFQRGTLWGALALFGWENLLRVLPASLQRFTFLHHIESLAGSRGGQVADFDILAQAQVASPAWVSALVLLLFGGLCWALAGWKLQATPVGLAGREAEG